MWSSRWRTIPASCKRSPRKSNCPVWFALYFSVANWDRERTAITTICLASTIKRTRSTSGSSSNDSFASLSASFFAFSSPSHSTWWSTWLGEHLTASSWSTTLMRRLVAIGSRMRRRRSLSLPSHSAFSAYTMAEAASISLHSTTTSSTTAWTLRTTLRLFTIRNAISASFSFGQLRPACP